MEEVNIPVDQIRVVEHPNTPTLFVTGIRGLLLSDGIATINLMRTTVGTPTTENAGVHEETVAKLAMPAGAFLRFAEFFGEQAKVFLDEGAIVQTPNDAAADQKADG